MICSRSGRKMQKQKSGRKKGGKEKRGEGEEGEKDCCLGLQKKTTKATMAALRVYNGGARRIKQRLDVRMIIL